MGATILQASSKSEFQILKFLKGGSYRLVYQAVRKSNGAEYALKLFRRKIDGASTTLKELKELAKKDIGFMHGMQNVVSAHVLRMITSGVDRKLGLYQILDPCQYDLLDYFQKLQEELGSKSDLVDKKVKGSPLSEEHLRFCLYMLSNDLAALHGARIIHGDLEPQNVMVKFGRSSESNSMPASKDILLKIGDFGFSKKLGSNEQKLIAETGIGSILYMDPEIPGHCLSKDGKVEYNEKANVWSLE